jgi:hypothetical protein
MSALAVERQRFVGPMLARTILPSSPAAILEAELLAVRLVADEELDTTTLEHEFPTVKVERVEALRDGELAIDDFAWRGSFDFGRFDDAIEQVRRLGVVAVRGSDSPGVACEVLARYQRFVARRNSASAVRAFDGVLTAHASLYDLSNPLVKTDLDHALDTVQWILRLDPNASLAAQVAALFHDIERLEKDAQEKLEHRAPDHRAAPKDPRTSEARDRTRAVLDEVGLDQEDVAHVEAILSGSEEHAREIGLLDEADALSFLSLESSRYADHFGLAQTRRKVAHTIGRLSPHAREKLAITRLRPDIERLLHA